MASKATIAELTYYPIKGCSGVSVSTAELTPAGLAHDRSFMVTGTDGVFRSQRRDPVMAVIRPEISQDGQHMTLRAPGIEALSLDVDASSVPRDVEMFKAPYRGIDQGDAVAGWLTEVLGAPSRLVRVPEDHGRVTDGLTPGTSGYADSCALHVVSRASLELLHARLAERGAAALPMDRFRPNIVVDGWDEPHTEDRVRHMRVGEAELGYAKLAVRCAVTTVEQSSGARTGPEPLRTLADYRRATGGGVVFGAKFAVLRPGKLSVGDEVAVSSWGESER
ncbi:molybdenum cofactor sulfurase [Streptomyces sp. NRRL F-5755]|uniref:MOSC domain-containing protein n=1 Tax=Streptomyces sp. NRRL F-5755 TaxID=1519475 RepID=UPI0006ADCD88|nr:MOSC N-terminal beta barrel domain-containing protein [Streptomyces sp. NRRL F-5755]KOT87801.1 molybdenum cofactor sulfurase [Streptomyces sp. NRRL F-5755]